MQFGAEQIYANEKGVIIALPNERNSLRNERNLRAKRVNEWLGELSKERNSRAKTNETSETYGMNG